MTVLYSAALVVVAMMLAVCTVEAILGQRAVPAWEVARERCMPVPEASDARAAKRFSGSATVVVSDHHAIAASLIDRAAGLAAAVTEPTQQQCAV